MTDKKSQNQKSAKSRIDRLQEAKTQGDDKAVEEIEREIFREWNGIPVRIKTRSDVQQYFKYQLNKLWEGSQRLQQNFVDTRLSLPEAQFEKEFSALLLSYWRGQLPHFESVVRQEELESEAPLIDSKEYRAVKAEIEMRIKLCVESLAKHEKAALETPAQQSFWLGTREQLDSLTTWLLKAMKIDEAGREIMVGTVGRPHNKGDEKIEWLGTQGELAVLCRWLSEGQGKKSLILPLRWVSFAKQYFMGRNGAPLSKNLAQLAGKTDRDKNMSLKKWLLRIEGDLAFYLK